MIPVIRDRRLAVQAAVAGLRHALEDLGAVRERGAFARGRGGIELAIDLRHRIAVTILRRRIERQPAVCRRMRIVVRAQPHGAALERARSPVVEELVAKQQASIGAIAGAAPCRPSFPRRACRAARTACPVAQRKNSREIRLCVMFWPGERLFVDRRLRGNELVAVHVAADEPRTIGDPVWKARIRRQQQQMRAPALP